MKNNIIISEGKLTEFLLYKSSSGELNEKVVCSILELPTKH